MGNPTFKSTINLKMCSLENNLNVLLALRLFPDRHLSDRRFPEFMFPDLHRDIHVP